MRNNEFQKVFEYETFDASTYSNLVKYYAFERELSFRDHYLFKAKLCTSLCFSKDFENFTSCISQCSSNLFSLAKNTDKHIENSIRVFKGLGQNESQSSKRKIKPSEMLDFPSHMYSGSEVSPEDLEKSHEGSLFGRNKVSANKQKKNRNKLFSEKQQQ